MNIQKNLSNLEAVLTDGIAAIGPWLTPIPSAALVARATVIHLGWSQTLGWVSAAIIESLGLTTVSTALTLRNYNAGRRKNDEPAPFALAALLVGVYLVSTVGLTVLLDIAPDLARFAPAIFPLLALVGAVNLAIRADHKRRVQVIADEKAERRQERQIHILKKVPAQKKLPAIAQLNAQNIAQVGVLDAVNRTRQARRDLLLGNLLDAYRRNPELGATEAARLLGVHRNTIYNYTEELVGAGRLSKNGNGWEVRE